jgi:hypothetical protein
MIAHIFDHLSDQELAERIDAEACESDRAFFRQHPQRSFRLRPAWAAEVEQFIRFGTIIGEPKSGWCWWITVQQILANKSSRVRARCPLPLPHDAPADPPEEVAHYIWDRTLKKLDSESKAHWQAVQRDIKHALNHVGEKGGEK